MNLFNVQAGYARAFKNQIKHCRRKYYAKNYSINRIRNELLLYAKQKSTRENTKNCIIFHKEAIKLLNSKRIVSILWSI